MKMELEYFVIGAIAVALILSMLEIYELYKICDEYEKMFDDIIKAVEVEEEEERMRILK